jgi:hypothetical protein
MTYIITGYDLVNGERTSHKLINEVRVECIADIDKMERKVEKRYYKRTGHTVHVYAIFKRKI